MVVEELPTVQEMHGRVRLTEQSGVSSESAVWNGRPVFVKVLNVDDPQALARFRHEGRVAASLTHPLIVPLLASTPRQLIFPLLEGGTLRERLERGALDVAQATEVTAGVLSAVAYMHAVGVTHHDLKPENVLVIDGQASSSAVRVVDFGMSHSVHLPLDIHSGTRMGTPHFMAPEQFLGRRGDPRSDLYSVGVLLFDCLAGHPPFDDAFAWLSGWQEVLEVFPGPAALHDLMRSAMSRDPSARPETAGAMLRALLEARRSLALPDLNLPVSSAAGAP